MTKHEWDCVLVLEDHDRTVYSIAWGIGKLGTTPTAAAGEFLGWVASTGGDGRINVWSFEVCRYLPRAARVAGFNQCDSPRNYRILQKEVLQNIP
jgi:hypothetical protein